MYGKTRSKQGFLILNGNSLIKHKVDKIAKELPFENRKNRK